MDIVNHSAGLICNTICLMQWSEGWLHLQMRLNSPTQLYGALCISDTLLLCLVVNSSDKIVPTQLYPKMMRNFNKLFVLLYFGHYIIFGQAKLYGLFGFKFIVTII